MTQYQQELLYMTTEQLAEAIRSHGEWDLDELRELVKRADMSEAFEESEDFESIAFEAAEKLGVEIL